VSLCRINVIVKLHVLNTHTVTQVERVLRCEQ
jgi:hypothetical protein